MSDKPRETIIEYLTPDETYPRSFEISLADLKTLIAKIESETPPEVMGTLRLSGEMDTGYDGDCGMIVTFSRMETPEEATQRHAERLREIEEERARSRAYEEQRELAQFLRLKAKFESRNGQ
jgi:hypothetical protein